MVQKKIFKKYLSHIHYSAVNFYFFGISKVVRKLGSDHRVNEQPCSQFTGGQKRGQKGLRALLKGPAVKA